MNFNTLEFALWLGLLLLAFRSGWLRRRWQHALLAASLLFYAYNGILFLGVFVAGILVNWGLALGVVRAPRYKRAWVAVALVYDMGVLAAFKYAGLLTGHSWLGLVLPAGISFHTFQGLGYVLDVAAGRERAEPSLRRFALFSVFFPVQIAGPILRYSELAPQLRRSHYEPLWRRAAYFLLLGCFKKIVLADLLGTLVDPVFDDPGAAPLLLRLAALYGYALQIYMDFSGYCDIAEGCASFFGIRLLPNFNAPYFALSLQSFWRRWHITLSRWLRDHLYIPLGGSRRGPARAALAVLVTMTLGGLWHGASWLFALWGLYHGLGLIAERAFKRPLGAVLTFHFVVGGWLLFRIGDMGRLRAFLSPGAPLLGAGSTVALLLGLSAIALGVQRWEGANLEEARSTRSLLMPPWLAALLVLACAVAILIVNDAGRPFIYFQF